MRTSRTPDKEDLLRWADGSTCYRYELHEMSHLSDDYEVIEYMSPAWQEFHAMEAAYFHPEHQAYIDSLCQTIGA